jgi:ABC-type transport system involved in multi-copper enzyme maturation permease subunit
VPALPEGVVAYRRWPGTRSTGARWPLLAAHEIRLALRGRWSLLALAAGLAWGLASVIELVQARDTADAAWVLDAYVGMLDQLRWAGVAVAIVIGAPLILEDTRTGALELYLTRGLTRTSYFAGKAAALLVLATASMALPAVVYYVASLAFHDDLPASWHGHAAAGLLYAVMWGFLVSGVALGASCATRSLPGAMLTVAGVFAGLHILVAQLVGSLTENPRVEVASPFAATAQALSPLWPGPPPHGFPTYWGLVAWAVLAILGWSLAIARNPRPRGEA